MPLSKRYNFREPLSPTLALCHILCLHLSIPWIKTPFITTVVLKQLPPVEETNCCVLSSDEVIHPGIQECFLVLDQYLLSEVLSQSD